jgi:hypothetical protein
MAFRRRREADPGKMKFRHKGSFWHESNARKAQARLRAQGLKTKVIKLVGDDYPPYSLYVMAKHDFWKRNFLTDRR